MVIVDATGVTWRTSHGGPDSDNRIEVAYTRGRYRLRGSKQRGGPVIDLASHEFDAFADGVREGQFDSLRWS